MSGADVFGALLAHAALALRPDALLTVSQWADAKRILSPIASGEPGRWRTDRTPYLRELLDRLSVADPCERVVLMAGAQLGKTETGLNWLGYIIEHAPGPLMIVWPTVETAKRNSKGRIQPMIDATPALKGRVADARSRDSGNTLFVKEFPGGVMVITGSNSAVGLRSTPVRYLFLDEVDGYAPDAAGEGDPISLAEERTNNFTRRKIFLCSTPSIKNFSRIETAYLAGDQRKFFVPCAACGEMQVLQWQFVKWPHAAPAQAYYECPHCGAALENWQKNNMLAAGEWRPTNPAPSDPRSHSYHLSSLYSPVGWVSWADLAGKFYEAKSDPVRLKVFVNTSLAETWDDAASDKITEDVLLARREDYVGVPPAVKILTAGVDIQDDRIEVEVVGWGLGEESWSIAYHVIYGDPSAQQIWQDLDAVLLEKYGEFSIAGTAVDTGHHTLKAYAFCKPRLRRRVWAIKGDDGERRPIWPKKPNKRNKGKVQLFLVGVDQAKANLYARLKIEQAGPGYCHFPADWTPEDFKSLTVEVQRTKFVRGFPRRFWWKPDGARNERLDCRVYAYAALQGWLSFGRRLESARPDGGSIHVHPRAAAPTTLETTAPRQPQTGGGVDFIPDKDWF